MVRLFVRRQRELYFPVSRPASVKSASKCFSQASFRLTREKYRWVHRVLVPELGANSDSGLHWRQGNFSIEFISSQTGEVISEILQP